MAPSTIAEHIEVRDDVASLQARAAAKQAEMNGTASRPPVADDYMYDFKYNHALPTTDVLGVRIPQDCDAQVEAQGIIKRLSDALGNGNAEAFADTFLEYGTTTFQTASRLNTRSFNQLKSQAYGATSFPSPGTREPSTSALQS